MRKIVIAFLVLAGACAWAASLVRYQVNAGGAADWDVLVNGKTVVRHRGTGFGASLYNGNINGIVEGGATNVLSVKRTSAGAGRPHDDAVSIDVVLSYAADYTGKAFDPGWEQVAHYSGTTSSKDIPFVIGGEVSPIIRGHLRADTGLDSAMASPWYYPVVAVFFLAMIALGFFAIEWDRNHVGTHRSVYGTLDTSKRTPGLFPLFVAFLGGSIGVVAGMYSRRHRLTDGRFHSTVLLLLVWNVFMAIGLCSPDSIQALVNGPAVQIELPPEPAYARETTPSPAKSETAKSAPKKNSVTAKPAPKKTAVAKPRYVDGAWVEGSGEVIRILTDDLQPPCHQRFLLLVEDDRTVLVAHNIDAAPRVDGLRVGDVVEFRGEFRSNDKGGVLHWTHSRDGRPAGWIRHAGRIYE